MNGSWSTWPSGWGSARARCTPGFSGDGSSFRRMPGPRTPCVCWADPEELDRLRRLARPKGWWEPALPAELTTPKRAIRLYTAGRGRSPAEVAIADRGEVVAGPGEVCEVHARSARARRPSDRHRRESTDRCRGRAGDRDVSRLDGTAVHRPGGRSRAARHPAPPGRVEQGAVRLLGDRGRIEPDLHPLEGFGFPHANCRLQPGCQSRSQPPG